MMRKIYLLLVSGLLMIATVNAQSVVFSESFEGTFPPAGWLIKNNGSGNSWSQYTATTNAYNGTSAMEYIYNTANAANTWAFSPAISLTTAPVTVTFWVKAQGSSFPESLKFTVGADTALASQTVLLDSASISNTTYRRWTASYTPANAGSYRFAFNCYSKADQYDLFVDSITVTQVQPPCTGTPLAGTVFSSKPAVCPNVAFALSDTGSSSASAINYQWQSSPDGSAWTDIVGATATGYSVTGIQTVTYYRRATTCTTSSITVYSNSTQVTLNPTSLCVCSPSTGTTLHSSTSTYIDSVIIPGTVLINSTGSTGPTNGYTLNTDTTKMPTLQQNTTYSITTTFSASAIASVWFDWNQSGTFDSSEWKQITSAATKATISFTVPATAKLGKTLMRIRSRASGNANGIADPCTSFASGETEDYLINVIAAIQCTGTPLGGTVIASVNPICANTAVTLSDTGSTAGVSGITYQWQSSTNGSNWTDIVGATADFYSFTGLATSTYFRRVVTCTTSTQKANSTALLITLNPTALCVCSPNTGTTLHSSTSVVIDSVSIIGTALVNNSGTTAPAGGYTLYTDTTKMPSLQQAAIYSVQTHFTGTAVGSVWFDWNQNGLFESNEWSQLILSGTSAKINITVPANALLGKTLMRVRSRSSGSSNAATDACTTFASGETEDYIIKVVAAPSCTGTPNAGTVIASANPICSSTIVVLTDTGSTAGVSGLIYQWQSSSDGSNWTDIAGANLAVDSVKNLLTSTYFRRATTCSISTLKAYSNSLQINVNPVSLCVCSPTNGTTLHSSTSPFIDTVIIQGTVLSNSTGATAPTNGYTLFTDTSKIPTLLPSSTYTLQTSFNGGAVIASVWFDWNQNGSFESTEWTQLTTNGTAASISFTVPANALLGKTLMRIRSRLTANANAGTDACTSFGSGETEDYTIVIGASNVNILGNIIYPNGVKIPNTKIVVSGSKSDSSLNAGTYTFSVNMGGNYTLRGSKTNDVAKANGVTSLDLALTQSHILGKNLLNSPYKVIAADVNGDGKVTTLDLVYMKRLILGIDTLYPSKKLWVFVDSNFVFANPLNPFPYKDSISFTNITETKTNQTFIGIKLGDVNWDWNPLLAKPAGTTATKTNGEMKLETDDKVILE